MRLPLVASTPSITTETWEWIEREEQQRAVGVRGAQTTSSTLIFFGKYGLSVMSSNTWYYEMSQMRVSHTERDKVVNSKNSIKRSEIH